MNRLIPKRQHVVNSTEPRSRAGDTFAEFAITTLRLAGRLTTAGDELAGPLGQTSARWQVLAAAASEPPKSVAQISRLLGLARQGVQRIADALELEGLTLYRDNPDHQRAKLVALSPKGKSVLAGIRERQTGWANRLGASLDAEKLAAATKVLHDVLAALAEAPES
jgi:DNA-binding MarR family transcriptional regulator